MPTRRQFILASAAASLTPFAVGRALVAVKAPQAITVYKDAGCQCCVKWVAHLNKNGFLATATDVPDMDEVKKNLRVPAALQSCHTAVVGKYVIEGHVPAEDIRKLLASKEAIQGLAAPGMPMGSPGMEGGKTDHYDVIAFTNTGKTRVYSRR
jgi:hypothetical protein